MNHNKQNIEIITRRQFLNKIGKWGGLTLSSAVGATLLGHCVGEEPPLDDLDPPFICSGTCVSTFAPPFDRTQVIGTTVNLVFSAYNNETNPLFTGYNVWYGDPATVKAGHKNGNRSLVLFQTGTSSLNLTSIGVGPFPSFVTAATSNQTSYVALTINGVLPGVGDWVFVSAYSADGVVDSDLSNGFEVI
ncbi:MAG: hypothetical protein OEZ36_02050 [Spirochaetota bacterium]|nr:hypothetical protein [Spirochaetota bacterium]